MYIYFYNRSNFPKELMEIPGFPFPKEWPSYITRQQMLHHLDNYFNHFNLCKFVKVGFSQWVIENVFLIQIQHEQQINLYFYTLQTGRIMVWWCPSVRPFVRVSPTCFDILSWNFVCDFVLCTLDQVWVPSICINFGGSYAHFVT